MQSYRTLWISDVHLGTKDCQAAHLNDFLKHHRAEKIYLVGDIIDGWKMQSGIYWKKDFTRVIRRLLTLSKRGVKIDYITGNHDEFLRRFANNRFDNIHLYNRVTHTTADGRKLLVIHGDQFDSVARCSHWLRFLGDVGYDLLMTLNRGFNSLRAKYGHGYWSLAGFLKNHIPRAQMYIKEYEHGVAYAAEKQGFDGVVCGHIHHAANKRIGNVDYYNTGDWVESCTALAEDEDGTIHLLTWRKRKHEASDGTLDQDEVDADEDDENASTALPPSIAARWAQIAFGAVGVFGNKIDNSDDSEFDDAELEDTEPGETKTAGMRVPALIIPC